MAKRSISDARQWLEDRAKQINPEAFRQYSQEIQQAEAKARQRGIAAADREAAEAVVRARQVSEDMCGVRDRARQLADEINTGRISAADAATELNALRSSSRRSRSASDYLVGPADRIDAIEADPVAYADGLAQAFPHMLADFSF